jgi:hypothetical protein
VVVGTGTKAAGNTDVDVCVHLQVHTSSRDPDAGVRFTMSDWLSALMVIATRVYPHLPVQEAWDKVGGPRSQQHNSQLHVVADVVGSSIHRQLRTPG